MKFQCFTFLRTHSNKSIFSNKMVNTRKLFCKYIANLSAGNTAFLELKVVRLEYENIYLHCMPDLMRPIFFLFKRAIVGGVKSLHPNEPLHPNNSSGSPVFLVSLYIMRVFLFKLFHTPTIATSMTEDLA